MPKPTPSATSREPDLSFLDAFDLRGTLRCPCGARWPKLADHVERGWGVQSFAESYWAQRHRCAAAPDVAAGGTAPAAAPRRS